jgi:hypothetical protein
MVALLPLAAATAHVSERMVSEERTRDKDRDDAIQAAVNHVLDKLCSMSAKQGL